MAKKVEGWTTEWAVDDAIRNGSGIELRRSEIKPLSTVKATLVIGDERVFTESEVRAMFQVLRSNEFFEDGGATLMHIDDFNARVQTFFSDPA